MTGIETKVRRVPDPSYRKDTRVFYTKKSEVVSRNSKRLLGRRQHRVLPEEREQMAGQEHGKDSTKEESRMSRRRKSKTKGLKVDTKSNGLSIVSPPGTPNTVASTPTSSTPHDLRGSKDLRSPGMKKTPMAAQGSPNDPIPDFITQTDQFGNPVTPRSYDASQNARQMQTSGPKPVVEESEKDASDAEACDTLLDSLRLMCCCLTPEEAEARESASKEPVETNSNISEEKVDRVRLLKKQHQDDVGKKCLVLDLDETLVHSSFRAVPGADFVIPVQIEDVVHFVYVAKRPGVDEFLAEMAKHYEIVIYTASLNKYADPLLDLLDPKRLIRARLFRESCVFYEGNYVKDLSVLDRDLSQSIIIDNSPNSYIFHPENAIDCSSFIDDPNDRELAQIAGFLKSIKDEKDVRHLCHRWKNWSSTDLFSKR